MKTRVKRNDSSKKAYKNSASDSLERRVKTRPLKKRTAKTNFSLTSWNVAGTLQKHSQTSPYLGGWTWYRETVVLEVLLEVTSAETGRICQVSVWRSKTLKLLEQTLNRVSHWPNVWDKHEWIINFRDKFIFRP